MSFLILCHVVITLFTFCTCQCYLYAHNFHLRFNSNLQFFYASIFGHKKKTSSNASLIYHTLQASSSLVSRVYNCFIIRNFHCIFINHIDIYLCYTYNINMNNLKFEWDNNKASISNQKRN